MNNTIKYSILILLLQFKITEAQIGFSLNFGGGYYQNKILNEHFRSINNDNSDCTNCIYDEAEKINYSWNTGVDVTYQIYSIKLYTGYSYVNFLNSDIMYTNIPIEEVGDSTGGPNPIYFRPNYQESWGLILHPFEVGAKFNKSYRRKYKLEVGIGMEYYLSNILYSYDRFPVAGNSNPYVSKVNLLGTGFGVNQSTLMGILLSKNLFVSFGYKFRYGKVSNFKGRLKYNLNETTGSEGYLYEIRTTNNSNRNYLMFSSVDKPNKLHSSVLFQNSELVEIRTAQLNITGISLFVSIDKEF